MTTPFGPVLATYPTRDAYYEARPALREGWSMAGPGTAPFGWDLDHSPQWLLVFCAPSTMFHSMQPKGSGDVVAFERASDELHVIAEDMDFAEAQRIYEKARHVQP